jgi:glycosyltransferase involved in cell wall biosynthesis
MRILHAIAGAPVGGAETIAQDEIVALHERGIRQAVLTRPYPAVMRRYAEAGITAIPFGFSVLDRLLLRGSRIRAEAAALGADLVHAWMSRANSFVPAVMPCPVIGWFGDYYDLKYFRHADFFFCITPDISRYVVAKGARPHRVFTVNTFGTLPDSPRVDRAALDTPPDVPVLLVLARMHRVKGIDTMLQALTRVPGAYLWLAGEGPAKAEYQALAARLGLAARVRFLGWRDDRKGLLEACDVFVLPSRYEPFGTVIVEAWATGKPLVATAAAGARQYVTDGVTGLLCPIEDAAALADCLRRVLGDAVLRRAIAAGGHAAYLANFTRDIFIDRLCASYERCRLLGAARRDLTVLVAGLDTDRIARLRAELPSDAGMAARARQTVEVAVAYAAEAGESARERAGDAALLQAAGLGSLIVGAPPRVLLLAQPDLAHAWRLFDRAAVDVKYVAFVDALLARLFEPPGRLSLAPTARR